MTAVTVAVSSSAGIDGAQDIGHNLSLLLNYLRVFVILYFTIVKPNTTQAEENQLNDS